MNVQNKICNRKMRNILKNLRRRNGTVLLLIVTCLLLFMWMKVSEHGLYFNVNCQEIDVVYTWVNGTDPTFIELAQKFHLNYDPARFDDKNELRYSLRSLELYAPWVRHVYIVTNGQIPHWLDLSYDRVTVVPHEALTPDLKKLPTFSSAAIETFIHRIPQLSKKFLYLNDDIFLGAPLYPEDLYTEADGVRIYQAWMVPDCAEDCPWTYIGDGACDRHCNIAQCQFDGGDCSTLPNSQSNELVAQDNGANEQIEQNIKRIEIKQFPKRKNRSEFKFIARNGSSFKDLMKSKNLIEPKELKEVVAKFNKIKRIKSNSGLDETTTIGTADALYNIKQAYKSTKDIYSHSLIYTNMLLNRHYGFKPRNVLAHVGFLLDRQIIDEMQRKFAEEIDITTKNRFRAANDVQFAFIYYSYVMSETYAAGIEEIFDEFDTDNSLTWSDREIRTFLARMYPLPLDWSAVRFFEEVIGNCSRHLEMVAQTESVVYSTLVYERYEDSTLPTVTRNLVRKCPLLAEALISNFGTRQKYKYNINPKRATHSNFMMLTSNVTEVVDALDKMRKNPRKFNCINDNLEPQHEEDNKLIRHLLEDFYLSFFPKRSKFELEPQYRNRYNNVEDYQRWRRRKRAALAIGYSATILLIIFILRFLCVHKAKFARRYVQKL